jgi:hypothetical protein
VLEPVVSDEDFRTEEICPSETESFPTSRIGPFEVTENPVTTPETGSPDASLPATVSPMRFAAAEVWSVVATCCSVWTWDSEASWVKKSALLVGSRGSWYFRLSTSRLRNSLGSKSPLLVDATLAPAASAEFVAVDGVTELVAGIFISVS